jgi:hypothetical protein
MAHRDERHCDVMVEWLVSMYQLTVSKATSLPA